ncbi:hypothetical protein DFP72DRAFT_988272 [Ephemerocybe angulata]|uniref:DH domain-containing protein n=1 Tax=Ephemerocybe angulata TaxID=980116 RepID=A0A8H6I6T5_9AGAR|nr:hypothetical protein DFP72DRAFT_988272 [Tulosesus angulatus]
MPHSDLVDEPPASLLSTSRQQRSPPQISPPIPVRSPLRPPARSISSQNEPWDSVRSSRLTQDSLETPPSSAIDDNTIIVDSNSPPGAFPMQERNSYPSIDELLDAAAGNLKTLADRSDSPVGLAMQPRTKRESSSSSSSLPAPVPPQSTMTKRQHALHEILSSERAYASDLALIREVHIPLALGQPAPLPNIPVSPPASSGSSSRTLSTASDSSTASLGTPMTQDDARIIFSNVSELAIFSDLFSDELELALGSVVEGGVGEDRVGELFCRIIPDLERPYQYYITRHPTALQHLHNLPQTPALQNYLAHTRNIATSLSHAWDLASLLIKPVQRLLKYPLLLAAVIDETPDSHPDKANLKEARARMEEVARNVNEVRRRAEVIKDVLTSKKKPVNVTVAASVNFGKMKNLRTKSQHVDENGEAAQVDRMSQELKRIELFAQQFAKNVVDWSRSMHNVIAALKAWTVSFGKVIGLSAEQQSEAFDAFLATVDHGLRYHCSQLDAIINERLLKEIAHLLKTMSQPYKLIASMEEQEPFHHHLLNMTVTPKNRPPPALLAASTNYLALRAQLAAELPTYLALLHQGMAGSVRRLADIQTRFWKDVKDTWAELWEMLRVEGELNAGRWLDVDEVLASLNINQARKIYQEPERARPSNVSSVHGKKSSAHSTTHMLSSLDPSHAPQYPHEYVSAPLPLAPASRSRRPTRRNSTDSLHSVSRPTKGKSPARKADRDDHHHSHPAQLPQYEYLGHPQYDHGPPAGRSSTTAIPRRKTRRTASPSRALPYNQPDEELYAAYINHPYGANSRDSYGSERERERGNERSNTSNGRVSRSTSTKKKTSETPAAAIPSAPNGKPQRPSHSRGRSSSITSFFKAAKEYEREAPIPNMPDPRHFYRDSWLTKPAKYMCQVIHPCQPPSAVTYFSFPFFTLADGDLYEILQEAGHPSIHPKLPLYVDDGEDCLLLCRDVRGTVGWALASFMEPVNISRR